jgi:uncharacterized membrane protein
METTILLSKVLGIFITIAGLVILIRRSYFVPIVNSFAKEHVLRIALSAIEMVAGLFLIMIHNTYNSLPSSIISIVGWLALLEGVFYFSASDHTIEKFLHRINTSRVYIVGGLFAIIVGIYLTSYGFNLI